MTVLSAQRGRPREFDTEVVLDRLLDVFWARGFEATSIADVVEATGLNKSSLYNSFGDKEALFATAVERYIEVRGSMLTDVLGNGSDGLDDIDRLLELQQTELAKQGGRLGCLVVNTSTELGLRNEAAASQAQRFRQTLRDAIRATFDRAEVLGEIEADMAGSYTEILVAFTMSLGVLSRGGASSDELNGQFAAMRSLVDGWRID
jgi:AcrR family transcriptional regulator